MVTINEVSSPAEMDAARNIIREFTDWAISLDPSTADAPTFAKLDDELAAFPAKFAPPEGCFLLAHHAHEVVGCIGFVPHGTGVAEIKRLYVRPQARGLKAGAQLVSRLIEIANDRGLSELVLDSYYTMTQAHDLYRSFGFVDTHAPADFPQALVGKVVFMQRALP